MYDNKVIKKDPRKNSWNMKKLSFEIHIFIFVTESMFFKFQLLEKNSILVAKIKFLPDQSTRQMLPQYIICKY